MIECETTLRAWGNSLGVIIPKDQISKDSLRTNQRVRLVIAPVETITVKDIFGKSKIKFEVAREHRELNREIDSKYF